MAERTVAKRTKAESGKPVSPTATATKTPAANPAGKKSALVKRAAFWRLRWFRYGVLALFLILLAPFLLTIIYRFEPVKPPSTLMIARHVTGQPVERVWRPIDEISPFLIQAVITSEDGKFCRHWGVDFGELRAVVDAALEGERTRGASTITMQVAKNLYLWGGRSFIRKGLELPLALWIDFIMPKKRIAEIYLNIVEWGDVGIFGAEAATLHHYGKSAQSLTRRQAALLAVTLPNPYLRDPTRPSSGMNNLARLNERRAQQSGPFVACLLADR